MSKLEYQTATAEVTNRPVGIGRPLRISEQGSDQTQGYLFIQQIIIDIYCVRGTEGDPMLGSRSTDVGQKTKCGRHVTSSPCIVTYSLPHAKLNILI